MNKKQFLRKALMLVGAVVSLSLFSACSESDGDVTDDFADWQQKNDTYFNKVYTEAQNAVKSGSKEWKIFTTWSINESVAKTTDNIVVKVLKEGTGSGCPLYTDAVYVHYIGHLIPSVSYPKGFLFDKSTQTEALNLATDRPVLFFIDAVSDGFSTALQHMHVGDYWRVYVPYQLGYKGVAQTGIPAYSTLIFDIYLCEYFHDTDSIIYWNAKETPWFEE